MSRWPTKRISETIALVRPYVSRWRLYRWYGPVASHEAPLGLLYIASHLSQSGFSTVLLDGERLGLSGLKRALYEIQPRIIGITSTTFSFGDAAYLINSLRKAHPNTLVIMGGSHVSAMAAQTMEGLPEVDACILGEGELALGEIAAGNHPSEIDGLVFREDSGAIELTKVRQPEAQLDRFGLNWSLLEGFPGYYQPAWQSRSNGVSVSLMASRGCGFNCSFCAGAAVHGKARRSHSPEYVVTGMRKLAKEYGISGYYFHDDYFTQDENWLDEFCERLQAEKMNIDWSCSSRLEPLNERVLTAMRKSGCFQIGIGVESAAPEVLAWMDKAADIGEVETAIHRVHQAGITVKAYVMVATPHDSIAGFAKTWNMLARSRADHVQVVYFTPLPGSRDYKRYPVSQSLWPRMNLLNPIIDCPVPTVILRAYEFSVYSRTYGAKLLHRIGRRRKAVTHA